MSAYPASILNIYPAFSRIRFGAFAAEAAAIADRQTRLTWLAPSRDENASGSMLREEEADIWIGSADNQPPDLETNIAVQGGRERGLILHKLMGEVLTGETEAAETALAERADHRMPLIITSQLPVLAWHEIPASATGSPDRPAGHQPACLALDPRQRS
ncbi:hypothetical protein [Mesorhizobium sp. 113-3-3]|uniref:hypothetical protein n=1 Tax=Mesorhizobium sp. 113-3-3 TaxID=2744516 RepID=UPI0018EB4C55|nr:hypothetical protein [Mesorhizobium sp. 113-3-3]BCG83284.1 hypothetical protein MesoLj113b_68260 [Mesorhizobium sp. 113-3-3]